MSQKEVFSLSQNTASDPSKNIWVQANAGTGKTTVLIRRLLRILFRNSLYNNDDSYGVLCLTYTNAAAGEMRNRILSDLRQWSMADDDKLIELLEGISENNPANKSDLDLARKIFYSYIDNPDILKIKTIHGFCEEILRKFPLEAGISPAWSLVSGSTQKVLLQQAFEKMINRPTQDSDTRTLEAFQKIINIKSEYFLQDLYDLLVSRYKSFFVVDNIEQYRKYFIENTKKILELDKDINTEKDIEKLRNIVKYAQSVQNSSKKPAKYIENIIVKTQQYIDNTIDFEKYKSVYLTQSNDISKNILSHDVLIEEATRVYNLQQYLLNTKIFENTLALFDLSMAFMESYKSIKQENNLLDFEDLILYTQKLFSKPDVMGWVLSQLDVSLSHILVDEAQDTSPQQWNILRMLAGDFFTEGNDINNRSLFVVGDTKQSIYGFQSADPKAFAESRKSIAEQIQQNYRDIQEVSLDQSFRSVAPILNTVDYFFDNPEIINQTGFHNNKHKCHRIGEQGFVELHNLFKTELTGSEKNKAYAYMLANKIESLIKNEKCNPKDIMVLVQKRGGFVGPLTNALKKKNIPLAGNDRVNLPEFPAIKDMLHLVRFCIDNSNDYSLCCLLKSPFYKLKEDDIFNLCKLKNNKNTIENSVCVLDVLEDIYPDIYNDLIDIIEQSKTLAPYSFFTYLLNKNNNREKIISALGKQVIDPLEEFLTMCLVYERTQSGTLYHFLKWFITGDSEIKRDMDASQGIRIMTVHGSKGLAAPIVFLIDTLTTPKNDSVLNVNYLHQNHNYDVWLWKTADSKILQNIEDKNRQDSIAEYYRLLYVAMTRTRDKLYIYGCDKDKSPDITWHNKLWSVLSQIKDAKVDEETIRITNDTKFD
ncbi:MAG: UvrD-helicase domain-containing protein [Alphaproteobacteria bacterium]|nr:UvrD-helicase domain-containing protein [Alphaproteobacteria bacterium]